MQEDEPTEKEGKRLAQYAKSGSTIIQSWFAGAPHILETHQGYDIGAVEVAREIEDLAESAFYGGCSRLLIDINRSLHHP